jgi:hypothetical protein
MDFISDSPFNHPRLDQFISTQPYNNFYNTVLDEQERKRFGTYCKKCYETLRYSRDADTFEDQVVLLIILKHYFFMT